MLGGRYAGLLWMTLFGVGRSLLFTPLRFQPFSSVRVHRQLECYTSFDQRGNEATLFGLQCTSDQEDGDSPICNDNDTTRVKMWRALASGQELTLKQLTSAVSRRNAGEEFQQCYAKTSIKDHLKHVARQAQTLKNKSPDWRRRRGLPAGNSAVTSKVNKLRLRTRRGKKNELLVPIK